MFTDPHPVPRVFVVAPALSGWGLQRLVESAHPLVELAGGCERVACAYDALEAVAAHVVLVDADDESEIDAVAALAHDTRQVILLTACTQEPVLDRAVLAGVRGVLHKTDTRELLLKAIEKVYAGQLWVDRSSTGRLFVALTRPRPSGDDGPEQPRIASLTMRERQTIDALAIDASAPAKVIADRLCISPHTLRNHLSSIYSKLGVTSRLDLYAYASRHRLSGQQHRA